MKLIVEADNERGSGMMDISHDVHLTGMGVFEDPEFREPIRERIRSMFEELYAYPCKVEFEDEIAPALAEWSKTRTKEVGK